jgi:hypothetical protein
LRATNYFLLTQIPTEALTAVILYY